MLDADHAGLEDVKDRIVEHIGVMKLRTRPRDRRRHERSGAILTLIGPPGTGKTSIGESIARATGREFVRMSLGGVRDEAEIRGHRRTYIGALPGRLVRALRDAKTMNPVIMLDEVDKVGADWRGDPSSALLEVLDPAQNHSFRDHYLDVELDLSQVLFIATANVADTIPAPLLDRMEVVRFDGYTVEEKVAIARDYLWPRQRERNGLREDEVTVEDEVLRTVVTEYTREAGVRNLERELGTVLRKTATRHRRRARPRRPWPSTWTRSATPSGARSSSRRRPSARRCRAWPPAWRTRRSAATCCSSRRPRCAAAGTAALVLTGQLGDVMKESARIALSYVRGHADGVGVDEDSFEDREFHVHVPAGAIPKDGPSAGVTMTTALASLLSGRPVKHTVGMTGEVTLQGRVLPIGGLKQKVLAAHAAGLTDVIIPERNRADLDEVPEEVRDAMTFHPVMTIDEVLDLALEPAPAPAWRDGSGQRSDRRSASRRRPPARRARDVATLAPSTGTRPRRANSSIGAQARRRARVRSRRCSAASSEPAELGQPVGGDQARQQRVERHAVGRELARASRLERRHQPAAVRVGEHQHAAGSRTVLDDTDRIRPKPRSRMPGSARSISAMGARTRSR